MLRSSHDSRPIFEGTRKWLGLAICLTLANPALSATSSKPANSKTSQSSSNSKPVLKAIDPSLAKMDSLPAPANTSPSPNPLGGISGAPISGDRGKSNLPPTWGGYQGQPAMPTYGGYPPPGGYPYQQAPAGYPQAPPGYPQAPPGYPTPPANTSYPPPQGYPPQGYAPPGYPSYPPQQAPYSPPQANYYGGQSQPGFGSYATPPGFVQAPASQPGGYGAPAQTPGYPAGFTNQQPGQQQQFNRARFGGGAVVQQGPPPNQNMQAPPGFQGQQPVYGGAPGGYPQPGSPQQSFPPQSTGNMGGYPQQNYPAPGPNAGGYPQQSYPAPGGSAGGYPQQPAPSYSGNTPGAQGNFPSQSLIPEFGKPLPVDASTRGPAQGWQTNVATPPGNGTVNGGGPGMSADPLEARVTRLEKIAFGATYPEHEVEDRVDHLEQEIFANKSEGDLSSRIARLEDKLGGRGSFGSPMKRGGQGQYGSFKEGSGSTNKVASGQAATALALNLNLPRGGPTPPASSEIEENNEKALEDKGQQKLDESTAVSSIDTAGGAASDDAESERQSKKQAEKPSQSSRPPKIPFDKAAGHYSNHITTYANNTSARWTQFPVRVRLPEDSTPEWRKLIALGLEKWGRYIPLRQIGAKEAADIEIAFVNHLQPRLLGVTRLTVNGGRMKVFIYLLRPTYYEAEIAERTLSQACVHELGHALGLFGHSDRDTDAMYPFEVARAKRGKLTQEKFGSISTRDVNTLKLIYDLDPIPEDFNLTHPQEWSCLLGAS